ncbi:MAG: sulfotransferase [Woeseiaceae bacterium]
MPLWFSDRTDNMNSPLGPAPGLNLTIGPPHFVGIGAPRCGTTWVFKMLRLHPDVWIPWKELHFFDSTDPETDSGYKIESRLFRFKHGWHYLLRRLAVQSIPGARAFTRRFLPLRAVHAPGYGWSARYLLGEASLEWYEGLFREGRARNLRCGEITPAYFMLSARGIGQFARSLPQVRAFLILRNPLDWAWSGICKDVRDAGQNPSALSIDELIVRCPTPNGRSRADFGQNLRRWLEHFPRERLLIGFHDQIRSEPVAFLERLCAFIGIGALPEQVRRLAGERINSSARGMPMPRAVERYVAERFQGEAEIMATLVGGPAEQWLEQIGTVLRGS